MGILLSVVVVSLSVVVEVVDAPSSLLLQEMTVRLKRKRENMMSMCFTEFPISGLGLPNIYQNLGNLSINGSYLEKVVESGME